MTESDPLLLAVERLVRPFKMPTLQHADGRDYLTVIAHDPLLKQLHDAVGAGIGGGKGSAGLDSGRAPLNLAALELRDSIHEHLLAWTRRLDVVPGPVEHDARTLVAWYRQHIDRYRTGKISDHDHGRRVARVRSWVEQIEQLFNPPEVVPLGADCPRCGARFAIEPNLGDRIMALAVSYWREGVGSIGRVQADCRACLETWPRRSGVAELMAEIAEIERLEHDELEQLLDTPRT